MFLGIDVGTNGGLALIHEGEIVLCDGMPQTEFDIYSWIREAAASTGVVAAVEKVHSMPGNSARSMFTFGHGYGSLRMALLANGIPFEEVTPQRWQKDLHIPPRKKTESKTQFKNRLKAHAQRLFSTTRVTLKTCDALLIAHWLQEQKRRR